MKGSTHEECINKIIKSITQELIAEEPSEDISLFSGAINKTKNVYYATIILPQKLTTTYKKHITFTPEMTGSAEIITKNLRLLDRIFNRFRKVFDE